MDVDRTWKDQRDGTVWRVESTPIMPTVKPGAPVPMMNEVPWRIWFHSDDEAHDTIARFDLASGTGPGDLPARVLEKLLDEARSYTRIDVDGELVTFYVGTGEPLMGVPLDFKPARSGRTEFILIGRNHSVATAIATPAPKDVIVQYDADELRALWRQRPK